MRNPAKLDTYSFNLPPSLRNMTVKLHDNINDYSHLTFDFGGEGPD